MQNKTVSIEIRFVRFSKLAQLRIKPLLSSGSISSAPDGTDPI